jgi:hypothetical protein
MKSQPLKSCKRWSKAEGEFAVRWVGLATDLPAALDAKFGNSRTEKAIAMRIRCVKYIRHIEADETEETMNEITNGDVESFQAGDCRHNCAHGYVYIRASEISVWSPF